MLRGQDQCSSLNAIFCFLLPCPPAPVCLLFFFSSDSLFTCLCSSSPALLPGLVCYFMSYVLTKFHSLRHNFLSNLMWSKGHFRLPVGWRHLSQSSLWTQAEVDTLSLLMCREKKGTKWEASVTAQCVKPTPPPHKLLTRVLFLEAA